jgi:Protein of unknown function (DUF3311)
MGATVKRAILVTLLLLLPYLAMMWVPSYNRAAPEIAGIPFFYWYQLLWIPLGSLLLLVAYLLWRPADPENSG